MDDDFNTPEAVAVLFELASEANRTHAARPAQQLRALGGLLGLLHRQGDEFLRSGGTRDGISDAEIAGMISERDEARRARDFRRSDEIRERLLERGVVLEDGPRGTTWRRV
jgi:cysteinyl-tRNA synthetase